MGGHHHGDGASSSLQTVEARVIVLGIPDDYEYMQPELVRLLEMKATPFLR